MANVKEQSVMSAGIGGHSTYFGMKRAVAQALAADQASPFVTDGAKTFVVILPQRRTAAGCLLAVRTMNLITDSMEVSCLLRQELFLF